MRGEQLFLESIAAEPSSSEIRLVYADWLEENGDESRAALVRAHEQLLSLSPLQPRFWDIKEEFQHRRWQVDNEWLAKLHYDCTYRPMFPQRFNNRAAFWRAIEQFIELWRTPLSRDSGHSKREIAAVEERLGIRLPKALRELYMLAGNRLADFDIYWPADFDRDAWHESLVPLADLRIDRRINGIAFALRGEEPVFYVRSKDLHLDDPSVWVYGWPLRLVRSDSLLRVSVRLTSFLSQWLFLAAHGTGHSLASGPLWVAEISLPDCFRPAQIPSWHCNLTPLEIWEADDVFILAHNHRRYWRIVARSNLVSTRMSPEELQRLRAIRGFDQFAMSPVATTCQDEENILE